MAKSLRDLVSSNPPLRGTPEIEIHSMLPGREDPRQHPLERLLPTPEMSVNPSEMRRRRAAGEVTEDQFVLYMDLVDPDWRERRPIGETVPDEGGVVRPYNPRLSDDEMPVDLAAFDATVIRKDE
jgi:hypothetical protein